MKDTKFLLLVLGAFLLASCSRSPLDMAQSNVEDYLENNLKNPSSYESIYFSAIDTFPSNDTSESGQISPYAITHTYDVINSNKDKIRMTIRFFLDKDLKVNEPERKSIDGEYGILTGNAYWKYNDYVGNKPDAGSEAMLYSLDSARGNLRFKATTDVQGNYKIGKIPPGKYLLIVRSNNATDCPENHLRNFDIYSGYLKDIFGFDLNKYEKEVDEINELDSLASVALKMNDPSRALDLYYNYEGKARDKANELFKSFPDDFKEKLNLYTGYGNALELKVLIIEEGGVNNNITDFGITCI